MPRANGVLHTPADGPLAAIPNTKSIYCEQEGQIVWALALELYGLAFRDVNDKKKNEPHVGGRVKTGREHVSPPTTFSKCMLYLIYLAATLFRSFGFPICCAPQMRCLSHRLHLIKTTRSKTTCPCTTKEQRAVDDLRRERHHWQFQVRPRRRAFRGG